MPIIAITGLIGSGKSTVGRYLSSKGLKTIDADAIVRSLQSKDTETFQDIVSIWGSDIIDKASGELDRSALGNIVFSDPVELEKLEKLVHPKVRVEIIDQLKNIDSTEIVLLELPLLKTGDRYLEFIDLVLFVEASETTRITRLIEHRGYSQDKAEFRVNSQIGGNDRKNLADHIVNNDGTLQELYVELENYWTKILSL